MRRARSQYCGGRGVDWIVLLLLIVVIMVLALLSHWRPPPPTGLRQKAQFNTLNAAIELFADACGGYPPSDATDAVGQPYCGSMKLTEALAGQDLLGLHSASAFRCDGLDAPGNVRLYPQDGYILEPAVRADNLKARKGPYIPVEMAEAFRLADIYARGKTGPFPEDVLILCDTCERKRPGGTRTGMPILYYRADPNGTAHDVNNPDEPNNIYDYCDNHALILLGVPGDPNAVHPLADARRFYLNTQDHRQPFQSQPYRRDSYILVSAGWDGLYGTADDICNFEYKYRER